jgi:molybdopterin-guanine dinucleotide biosynthesis protein A
VDPATHPPASCGAVLAGGLSRRFGSPKALARVGGRTLLERALDSLRQAGCGERVVVGEAEDLPRFPGVPRIADPRPGHAALGGLEGALAWAEARGHRGTLLVACDMPFLSAPLLAELARRGGAGGAQVVLPVSAGRRGVEPLCAWYAVECLPAVRQALGGGDLSLHGLLTGLRVARLERAEVDAFGPPEVLFFNLNTPQDLLRAAEIASSHVPA